MQTCLYSKALWTEGGIGDQPSWFVDIFKDFAPLYQGYKQRAQWGGGSEDKSQNNKHAKKKSGGGKGRQSLGGR